jgi:hypothetical protein
MKLVKGWWLPDSDEHFATYIGYNGYQALARNTILNLIEKSKRTQWCNRRRFSRRFLVQRFY